MPISWPLYSKGLVFVISGAVDIETSVFGPLQTPYSYRAYDAETGALVWQHDMEDRDGSVGTIGYWATYEDWLIVGSEVTLNSVASNTGKFLWLEQGSFRGFSVADGKVFVTKDQTVEAYDVATGDRLWQAAGPERITIKPLYDPQNDVVAGIYYTGYYVYDADTGTLLLKAPPLAIAQDSYGFVDSAQVYDSRIFIGDQVFDVMTGNTIHAQQVLSWYASVPFIANNRLILNTYRAVVAEDLTDFSIAWQYEAQGPDGQPLGVVGDPVALDGVVYALLSDASIRALDLETGMELGTWQGTQVIDRRNFLTPFIPDLEIGDHMLFASFGTNELCGFGKEP